MALFHSLVDGWSMKNRCHQREGATLIPQVPLRGFGPPVCFSWVYMKLRTNLTSGCRQGNERVLYQHSSRRRWNHRGNTASSRSHKCLKASHIYEGARDPLWQRFRLQSYLHWRCGGLEDCRCFTFGAHWWLNFVLSISCAWCRTCHFSCEFVGGKSCKVCSNIHVILSGWKLEPYFFDAVKSRKIRKLGRNQWCVYLIAVLDHGIVPPSNPSIFVWLVYFCCKFCSFFIIMSVVSGEVTLCVSTMGKNKCESWKHFGIVFKLEGNKSSCCTCLACHESKVTSDCMMCMITKWYCMVLYNALFAQRNYINQE